FQEAFSDATPQRTDKFRLCEHGRIDRLPALLRDDSVHPCCADFHDVALRQGTGIKIVGGHYRRSSRIVHIPSILVVTPLALHNCLDMATCAPHRVSSADET